MKRIITCIFAITFLFILFYAPIYIPNEEFEFDITSAYLGNTHKEYLTEQEVELVEKWLLSLRPYIRHGIEAGVEPIVDYVNLYIESGEKYINLRIPAFYYLDTPDFTITTMASGLSHNEYVSQNQDLTWEVYDMLQDVYARREDNFKKLLESKKAAN